jgi:maleylacetate reductase
MLKHKNPIVSLLAKESIKEIVKNLEYSLDQAGDESNIDKVLYGAFLAGTCLGNVGMSLHHKVCHTLGGSFNLSHADILRFMLPYTLL